MKKIIQLTLLAGLASLSAALAQTNTIPAVDLTNNSIAPVVLTTNNDVSTVTNQTTTLTVTSTTVSNTTVATAEVTTSNSVPDATSGTNAAAAGAGIPLIQFSDVPITTAIENLARQAGINYMLDPKIGYGVPDQNGQIKTEPQLSIRWENISAENALIALLDNYGLQLVRDSKTGIDRIALKDPTAPPPLITRVVQLKYSSVSNMTEAVQSVLTDKRSKVLSDSRTSQLVVVATDPEQLAVDTLIANLDKPTKQVLIEAKLVEITSNPTTKKGVDWTSTLSGQNVTFGNGAAAGTTTTTLQTPGVPTTVTDPNNVTTTVTPASSQKNILNMVQSIAPGSGAISGSTVNGLLPTTGFLNADGLHAVMSFINSSSDAQVVSTPRIVTLDNEAASISYSRAFPIINISAGTANTAGGSSVTYSNVGTALEVTPRISANDTIWLKVNPTVSNFAGKDNETIGGQLFASDIFDTRQISTQVLIPNGDTLVMGGLIQDNPTANYTKVPLLGDVPGLGWAFRSESKSLTKDNLIIFLTPTIVKDTDFQTADKNNFLASKPKTMRSPMNPHSLWDGSEPRTDWSNPAPMEKEFQKQPITPDNNNY